MFRKDIKRVNVMKYNYLFEPIQVGGLTLKNRMIVSAMVTQYTNEDGTPTEKYIQYHERKAKGGWGLVITEDYGVTKEAGAFKRVASLWKDEQIQAHKAFVDRVHRAGGTICAQIYHAGRENTSRVTGKQPIAPSAIKEPTMPEIPHEMTIEEIHDMVEAFGDCALRVKKCGFDMVEVHGGHGYLVHQFVSPFSNKRQDAYGGSIYNRARFALEIIENIRKKAGEDFPICFRLSVNDYVPGGTTIQEAQIFAQMLEEAGVSMLHCTQGMYVSRECIIPPTAVPKAYFVENAAAIRQVVSIPVVAVGRINDPDIAEMILKSGKCDLVTMARSSLADPDLPNKAKNGQNEDILRCIGCCQGCTGENARGNQIRCLVNPMTGMEDEYDISLVKEPKNIMVIGGGVAGCEAAIIAARRGHRVTIYEKSDVLGGQWIPASVPVHKEEFNSFLIWQRYQIEKLKIRVVLNTEVNEDMVMNIHPDGIIIATGSKPFVPPIKGILESEKLCYANDVLLGKKSVGKQVLVLGGGLVGAETAEHLALHGSKVTLVEMLSEIAKDAEISPRNMLMRGLREQQVQIWTSTKVVEIRDGDITVETKGETLRWKDFDSIVLASGVRSYNPLGDIEKNYDGTVLVAGDAKRGKNGYLNIREGFEAGLQI